MKNYEIINLVTADIYTITANELDAANAYKVIGFKRAIRKAMDSIMESEAEFLKEVGIGDARAFDSERDELRKTGSNPERLAELDKTYERLAELRTPLYNEEAVLDCKTMPFVQFHILQKENKNMSYKPLNAFEDTLEGVLWVAPKEEN